MFSDEGKVKEEKEQDSTHENWFGVSHECYIQQVSEDPCSRIKCFYPIFGL